MAGNTKLRGFLDNDQIQLERWGTVITVQLNPTAIMALRQACFNELPVRPLQYGMKRPAEFSAEYDPITACVRANLSVEAAGYLSDLLDVLVKDDVQAMSKVRPWADTLRTAVQAHKDYYSLNEPGVSDE